MIKAILTGATGMVGEGVLHECLLHDNVEEVLVVGRRSCGVTHPKLKELIIPDFFNLTSVEDRLVGYNACFFCLGVSSVGMKEPDYHKLTYELTMNFATILVKRNPEMIFCYISGKSTNENGKMMWARVKGKTESDLMKLNFKRVYNFRPGVITPTKGLKNTLSFYKYLGWLIPFIKFISPGSVSSLKELGLAMINAVDKGYEKQILEVKDIATLSKRSDLIVGHTTPGVYIDEMPHLPPSITSIETAIPAFIGYTEKAQENQPNDLRNKPKLISSMLEYERFFGLAQPATELTVTINDLAGVLTTETSSNYQSKYLMYYSLQLFFVNGGSKCYIISVESYSTPAQIDKEPLSLGLDTIAGVKDITLIMLPDAMNLANAQDYYLLQKKAITQSHELRDRFVVMDVFINSTLTDDENISIARSLIDSDLSELSYAAIYYPRIFTQVKLYYQESFVKVNISGDIIYQDSLENLKTDKNIYYLAAQKAIDKIELLLPSSPAVVGIYAEVDNNRGVWKAPTNEVINLAIRPEVLITDREQESFNVDPGGKSINVIRSFPGKGAAVIWGARTLAGNDNEWRYISVRRFFIMIEGSVKKELNQFSFEPNDANTWAQVKAMIEIYLTQQWKAGALQGMTTREAFFVHVGLNETMTEMDIQAGRMIIEMGLATVRPAEFIILRITQSMLTKA
jgi:phage tail sheath protein FI